MDEDVWIVQFNPHLLRIGDKIGRDVAAVELHAFDDFELGVEALGFLDRDHSLVANLLHCIGEEASDLLVTIGRDRSDLRNFVI
ncbi:hypothetical protein SAMN05216337_10931 [Bradyrhizobium brasilense]|uniref:Uncharacterized protein n=1 Tax=Bradyrhizobium brasilense TaxID=1419277 RepID=A0A1G7Q8M4_9BRAD|nr:hypothetical protein SAMN05216337_10931 [Bradyrhizobium brasilense]